jgi:hypothetical protein
MKPEKDHGYTDEELQQHIERKDSKEPIIKPVIVVDGKSVLHHPDPLGKRTGYACLEDQAAIIQKELDHALTCLSTVKTILFDMFRTISKPTNQLLKLPLMKHSI